MFVRKIKEDDLSDLNELYFELCEEEGDVKRMKETFKCIEQNRDYYLIGAEEDGKIVGSIMGIVCYDLVGKYKAFMTVENVIVGKGYRGKGIARALFQYMEEIAHERECTYIYLVSGNQREVAHIMYERLGYRSDNVKGFRKYLIDK